jgi:HTH-type transcriptional repressor of NAD biosynthesis genes
VAVCSLLLESIPGDLRYQWTKDAVANIPSITVDHITEELPGSSESSREISKIWADYLKKKYPSVDLIVSSEPYGEYVAEYMHIDHATFDIPRTQNPISGTDIRNNPFAYREFIPEHVRGYFVKKICIVGSESTGKSTLTRLLAEHFNTVYVEEMARYLVSKTQEVLFQDLQDIAVLHAQTINKRTKIANKLLFVDTDVNITKSYANYLFNKELKVDDRIHEANQFDLYLFLESDCTFVQDGTRLEQEQRAKLSESHKQQLRKAGIHYEVIT